MSSTPPPSPKVPPAPAASEPRARAKPRPPNLYLENDPLARPEVKALLSELGVQPGEDPLYAALPEEAPDPDACAPDEAQVYMGPKTVPPALRQHKTVDMFKVRVAPEVDPRRAVTQRVQVPAPVAVDQASPSSPAGPESKRAGRGRWLIAAALGLAAVGVAVLVLSRGPRGRAGEGEAALEGPRGSAGGFVRERDGETGLERAARADRCAHGDHERTRREREQQRSRFPARSSRAAGAGNRKSTGTRRSL